MIKIFTSTFHFTDNSTQKSKTETKLSNLHYGSVPSAQTIANILNYSKNLEVLKSVQLEFVSFVKS